MPIVCQNCNGKGFLAPTMGVCPRCHGLKHTFRTEYRGSEQNTVEYKVQSPCYFCKGTGQVHIAGTGYCSKCAGTGKLVTIAEQQRKVELRTKRREALKVAIVYDTSYLMGKQPLLHGLHPWRLCSIANIVATEVEEEINKLIIKDSKLNAGSARGLILDLKQENAINPQFNYQNVQLSDFVQPKKYSILLDPDSATDSLLIEYGLYLLQQKAVVAVVVASRDSGIGNYLLTYRIQTQTPIFYVSDHTNLNQVKPFQDFLGLDTTLETKAEIEDISVEFGFSQNGEVGLAVHVKFQIWGRKGTRCHLTTLFYLKNGQPLNDFNNSYRDREGKVATGRDFIPEYDKTLYEKLTLFIPYSELHLVNGLHDLMLKVFIFDAFSALDYSDDCFFWVHMQ